MLKQKKTIKPIFEIIDRDSIDSTVFYMLIPRSGFVRDAYEESDDSINEYRIKKPKNNNIKSVVPFDDQSLTLIRHIRKQTNGAFLPELVYNSPSKIDISRSALIQILKIENKLRLSELTKQRDDLLDGSRLMTEIDQDFIKEALRYYGYRPEEDDSLKAYHLACGKYINDPEIKELVVWMKYDKMRLDSVKLVRSMI